MVHDSKHMMVQTPQTMDLRKSWRVCVNSSPKNRFLRENCLRRRLISKQVSNKVRVGPLASKSFVNRLYDKKAPTFIKFKVGNITKTTYFILLSEKHIQSRAQSGRQCFVWQCWNLKFFKTMSWSAPGNENGVDCVSSTLDTLSARFSLASTFQLS
jgi:hypothetical protein